MKTPFVNIHTHHNNNIDNQDFIEIRNIDADNIVGIDVSSFYSVGLHPWKIQQTSDGRQALCEMSRHLSSSSTSHRLVAIGECGIDRVCEADFKTQKEIFIRQIELSERAAKPMIIHAVRSYPDIIAVRKETKAKQPWIIHGFQGNEQSALQLLSHDISLSLGEVLFRDEHKASALLDVIPKDRLFLETDDSGRDIVDVYEKACTLTSVDIDELKSIIFNNFVKIFGRI